MVHAAPSRDAPEKQPFQPAISPGKRSCTNSKPPQDPGQRDIGLDEVQLTSPWTPRLWSCRRGFARQDGLGAGLASSGSCLGVCAHVLIGSALKSRGSR